MAVTVAQLNDALASTLSAAAGLTAAHSYDELTEGINDPAILQVYPESIDNDAGTNSDRTTMRAGVRQKRFLFHADLFAQQRRHIGEDMARLVSLIDALIDVLDAQDTKPYFGQASIKGWRWSMQRVTFDYGGVLYVGARFSVEVWVY